MGSTTLSLGHRAMRRYIVWGWVARWNSAMCGSSRKPMAGCMVGLTTTRNSTGLSQEKSLRSKQLQATRSIVGKKPGNDHHRLSLSSRPTLSITSQSFKAAISIRRRGRFDGGLSVSVSFYALSLKSHSFMLRSFCPRIVV